MAELFGGEEPEVEAAAVEADATALGVALDRVRSRRRKAGGGEDAADRLLEDQRGLIADQRHHLREQFRHLGLKLWSERLRLTLQVLTVLAGLLALGAVLWTAWQAHEADGIIIKPFTVPPSLSARGVTGEAVASRVMDRLATMAEIARPSERQKSVDADWGQHIAIEIPETGVSLSQLDQWLREKLGHERRISGEISINPDGTLTLDARLGGHPLPSQTGPEADLDKMETKVAEAVYGREQPISMFQYLGAQGRWQEALEASEAGLRRAKTPEARALALNGIGLATGAVMNSSLAAKPYYERALAMTPNINPFVPRNLANIEYTFGHTERAHALTLLAMARERVSETETPEARRTADLYDRGSLEVDLGDLGAALRDRIAEAQTNDAGFIGDTSLSELPIAQLRARLHEPGVAIAAAQAFQPRTKPSEALKDSWLSRIYAEAGDWAQSLLYADQALALASTGTAAPDPRLDSVKGRALARLGRLAEARAVIAPIPTDCSVCLLARADLAEAAGDRAGADRWFAEWVRQTPSLPSANEAWGRVLLARGDAKRALARFDAAHAQGPRFADAIEGRGEALLALGDAAGADKAFADAAKLTPKWGRLHLKWGEALAQLGKAEEARAQFKAAAGLDLTAAERAELAGVFHG